MQQKSLAGSAARRKTLRAPAYACRLLQVLFMKGLREVEAHLRIFIRNKPEKEGEKDGSCCFSKRWICTVK